MTLSYKLSFFTKILSISITSLGNKVKCDCEIYSDLSFLIVQLDKLPDIEKTNAIMEDFDCFKPRKIRLNAVCPVYHRDRRISDSAEPN